MIRHASRLHGVALLVALSLFVACAPGAGSPAAPAQRGAAPPQSSASAASGMAPSAGAPLQALIDAARQEGQLALIWGENTAGGTEGARRWAEGFNQLYGLNLDVRFTPGPSMPEVAAKVAQELQAGRTASTDILMGSETHIASLIQGDALHPVDWASWAPNIQDPRLVAPGGAAVAIASRAPGITYHSGKLTGDAVPATLQDVLKPQYKGRVASTPYAANFDRLASPEQWGEPRTVEYVRKLAEQVTVLVRCGEVPRLLTGEFDMLVTDCGGYDAYRLAASGAPVGHVIPADAATLVYWYMGVPRNAAHPAAAKLWINYVMSRHGQDILFDSDYTDHHLVPGSKSASQIEAALARGIRFMQVDVEFVQRNDEKELNRIRNELQRILANK